MESENTADTVAAEVAEVDEVADVAEVAGVDRVEVVAGRIADRRLVVAAHTRIVAGRS